MIKNLNGGEKIKRKNLNYYIILLLIILLTLTTISTVNASNNTDTNTSGLSSNLTINHDYKDLTIENNSIIKQKQIKNISITEQNQSNNDSGSLDNAKTSKENIKTSSNIERKNKDNKTSNISIKPTKPLRSNSDYAGKTIEITDDNYEKYFNKYTGYLLSGDTFKDGDILKIGNVTNRIFKLNKKLYITSISPNDIIRNGAIYLLKGSDGSVITKINIQNKKSDIDINGVSIGLYYGIYLNNTNNNIISFNKFNNTECNFGFAFYAYNSSYNNIIYNSFHTGNSRTESTSCLVMDLSNYNNISYNNLTTVQSNCIYLNHLGWMGATDVCIGTLISNNYMYSEIPSQMSYGMQIVYGKHNNTKVINNTIEHVSDAINLDGENVTIIGNKILDNTESGIAVKNGENALIENNTILTNKSVLKGIISYVNNTTISNNYISMSNGAYSAIDVYINSSCYNNIIKLNTYGIGIVTLNNNTIFNNTIINNKDPGIQFNGSNNRISENYIETNSSGISANSPQVRIKNNTILANTIFSDGEGIYTNGLIYNTTIGNNIITTNATGIKREITDNKSDNLFDNIINGILTDPTAITINDDNFYDFFTKDGYLNYTFKENANRVIIFGIITNKKIIINNKMVLMSNMDNNFLYNVTIDLVSGSDGTIIKDLTFYNLNNDKAITVNNTNNIQITGNNITLINNNKNNHINGISIINSDDDEIANNNIYIETNTKADGINLSNNSSSLLISKNNIVIKSDDDAKGISAGLLNESKILENYINIYILNNSGYGVYINGGNTSNGTDIDSNRIILKGNSNAYPIFLNNVKNFTINNNDINTKSDSSKTIIINNGSHVNINKNQITAIINKENGNDSIFNISRKSNNIQINDNSVDSNIKDILNKYKYSLNVDIKNTNYIIGDYNFLNYFTSKTNGRLNGLIKSNDKILFKNLSTVDSFIIDVPLNISSYDGNSIISSTIIFNKNGSNSIISDLIFNQVRIILNNTENLKIYNNIFRINNTNSSPIIIVDSGLDNNVSSNEIVFDNCSNVEFLDIKGSRNSVFSNNIIQGNTTGLFTLINNENSRETRITNNKIVLNTDLVKLIESVKSNNTEISSNDINIQNFKGYGYFGNNTINETIKENNIFIINKPLNRSDLEDISKDLITGNQTGIYSVNSNSTLVEYNHIESLNSKNDYCVYIPSESSNTYVRLNYLVSDNNRKTANSAVYFINSKVYDNSPYEIYISPKGSDENGDGSKENPYKTIARGLSKGINSVIYLDDGDYFESNLTILKNITLSGINPGKVTINLNQSQLFTIDKNGSLTVERIRFIRGNSSNGTVFLNNGILNIINSTFEDNNATNVNKTEVSGFGGVATNYGNLNIINSSFNNNIAHKGGAIRNYGNLMINQSRFYNNSASEGGVIYNQGNCSLYNSNFNSNTAINSTKFCITYKSRNEDISKCCNLGSGAVIFNTGNSSLIIKNCKFDSNNAINGGAIYFNGGSNSTLEIYNSIFNKNKASNSGGAIDASTTKLIIKSTNITKNEANKNGGGASLSSDNGIIDSSSIIGNIANNGGGLYLSGNITITNSFISNNTASEGGAINYNGNYKYNHFTNHVNIFNSTINGNRGLNTGGAIQSAYGNISISHSNIMNNFAPDDSTIKSYNKNVFDVDNHNWWGSSKGPDDSVWRNANLDKRDWAKSEVEWYKINDNSKSQDNTGGIIPGNSKTNTNLPSGTGTSLIPNPGSGNGNSGSGNGNGNSGSGNGNGTGNGNSNGGNANGQGSGNGGNGNSNGQGSSGAKGATNGQGQGNVGVDGPNSGGANPSGAGSSSGSSLSSGLSKAYELTKEELKNSKKVDPNTLIYVIIMFAVLIYIGYRKEKRNDDYKWLFIYFINFY